MSRARKAPQERRSDILRVAAELFADKGYSAATVNDVVTHAGIAKGTFYYYFASKDALLEALIDEQMGAMIELARATVEREDLSATEKLLTFWNTQRDAASADGLTSHIEEAFDEATHIRLLSRLVLALGPELTPIVEQGVTEGTFSTPYPAEAMDLILASSAYLFDSGLLTRPDADPTRTMQAFLHHVEALLAARPGTFSSFAAMLG